MLESTCFMIGHRYAPAEMVSKIEDAAIELIQSHGVMEFTVGSHGDFDRLALQAIVKIKQRFPMIKLTNVLAYLPSRQSPLSRQRFDATFYPPGMESVPKRLAIIRANEYMVRQCGFLLCYDARCPGNTKNIVDIAMRRQTKGEMLVINLANDS